MRLALNLIPFALSLGLATAPAAADKFDPYRVACQPAQEAVVEAALNEARAMLSAAGKSLPPVNSDVGAKFKRWFGVPEGGDDPLLKQMYAEIAGFLSIKTFWCPNKSIPDDLDPGALAFVPRGSFAEIFLESGFFDLLDQGADSKGGTIVHEASHQSTVRATVDSDVTGDSKPDYGTANAEQLARTRPNDARRTGDNVEYFAEDVYFGIP